MGLTLVEKLATRFAVGLNPGEVVRSGDFVTIRPRHVMTHDNTAAVMPKFKQICGAAGVPAKIKFPHQPVFAIDHDIQSTSPENLGKYAKIEAFANEQGVDFYPAGTGISHQVMVEQGYVTPGSMVVASDSHSNLYGALCCLGTPVVHMDAAGIWATGQMWWQAPPVARVVLRNALRPGVAGKDVIVALCGLFNKDEVLNHAVEFSGDGVASLSIDQRMSIANMSSEWGALAGLFPFDLKLRDYLYSRADAFAFDSGRLRPGIRRSGSLGFYTREDVDRWAVARDELRADADARYAIELELDLSSLVPHVSCPNDVKTMVSLPEIESRKVPINKAWLMSCVNARNEDLVAAATIMRGKRVAKGVEFYVAAASAETQRRAERDGTWQALVNAGAIVLTPGCGTCIGLGAGTIKKGEIGISATNRNFEGRTGDREGLVYLGSPAVVAASTINGFISSPVKYENERARTSVRVNTAAPAPAGSVSVLDGFHAIVKGRVLFLNKDNLHTDAINAGKHTYNDALTTEQRAGYVFENYDPSLRSVALPGDIIVSGLNFGAGSPREQAATALKQFGISCVIAASFSDTCKRNAFNNGLVVFECPAFVAHLRSTLGANTAPTVAGPQVTIDYARSVIECDGKTFAFPALSPVAQELVVAGGAENMVAARLKNG